MAGRRPKDQALKVLQGNAGKRDSSKEARGKTSASATPTAGAPDTPKHLSKRAREAWEILVPQLQEMGVLATVHGMPLELLCDAYGEYRQARAVVEKKGQSYRTVALNGSEMFRLRPEVKIASDAWRRVKTMMTEFGITAASMPRVRKIAPKESDQFELFLMRGGKAGREGGAK